VRRLDTPRWCLRPFQADTDLRNNVVSVKQTRSQEKRSLEIGNVIDRTCKRLATKKGYLWV